MNARAFSAKKNLNPERLMQVLKKPCDEQPEHHELAARRPEWARHKAGCSALSCSS